MTDGLRSYGVARRAVMPGVRHRTSRHRPAASHRWAEVLSSERRKSFCWRVQQLLGEGGFALVTGAPGTGKPAALRILAASLATQRDVIVGVVSRPQAAIADFYREMGDLFGAELRPHNRWGGAKILRQRWHAHIQSTLSRPVLLPCPLVRARMYGLLKCSMGSLLWRGYRGRWLNMGCRWRYLEV